MNKGIIIGILGSVLLGVGFYELYNQQDATRGTVASTAIVHMVNSEAGVDCYVSSKYVAIQKSLAPSVGSDILIKYKTNTKKNFDCAYVVEAGDFEIKNNMAEYFLAFTDTFFLLDQGTAPEPRGLVVYDLRSRSIVFNDSYAKPVAVMGDSITYWTKTDQKPTLENCSDLTMYTKNGLGTVMVSHVSVNLLTLSKVDLGDIQCKATQ